MTAIVPFPAGDLRLSHLQTTVLSPQAVKLFQHLSKVRSITAREAMLDLDMPQATLTRRICDLIETGVIVRRERRKHPTTGKLFTRYHLDGVDPDYGLRNKRRG